MTDYKKFRAMLFTRNITISELAKRMGITFATLSSKANNRKPFTTKEVQTIQDICNLSKFERDEIFFAERVDKTSTETAG